MVQFTTTEAMAKCLAHNNIKPEDYKPAYGGESVGLDLYNASETRFTVIPSRQGLTGTLKCMIPSGIKVALPPFYAGFVLERGSITKTPLKVRAGVLDPGYTAELFINCVNIGSEDCIIEPYSKLPFQLVVVPCVTQYCFIDNATYEATTKFAQRKERSIGSSDVHRPVSKRGWELGDELLRQQADEYLAAA